MEIWRNVYKDIEKTWKHTVKPLLPFSYVYIDIYSFLKEFFNTFYIINAISLNNMEQTFWKCLPVSLSITFQHSFNTCVVLPAKNQLKYIYFYCLIVDLYFWASKMFPAFSIINNFVIIVLRGMYLFISMIISLGIPRNGVVRSKGIYFWKFLICISRLAL